MKEHFLSILTAEQITDDQKSLEFYARDWNKELKTKASLVLFPKTTEEVSEILKICNKEKLAVIPSGGRTCTSGGAAALNGEIILSLEKMNKILNIDTWTPSITCEAGTITQKIQEEATRAGFYFPVDFASAGSSQIGGNVSTDAGGLKVIKYGNIRNWVMGMTCVLADGSICQFGTKLLKDTTGYDFKSLIIGSEGTLAIVTEVTLKLTNIPEDYVRIICTCESRELMLKALKFVRERSRNISMCEFIPRFALDMVLDNSEAQDPFPESYNYYLLFELEGNFEKTKEQAEKIFVEAIEAGILQNTIISQSEKQAREFLNFREAIPEISGSLFTKHRNDISAPVSSFVNFLNDLLEISNKLAPEFQILYFGHLGDGNVHFDYLMPKSWELDDFSKKSKEVDKEIYKIVKKHRGSIAAEHGVGVLKKPFLQYSRSETEIQLMKNLKKMFDPNGIINPGKIFD